MSVYDYEPRQRAIDPESPRIGGVDAAVVAGVMGALIFVLLVYLSDRFSEDFIPASVLLFVLLPLGLVFLLWLLYRFALSNFRKRRIFVAILMLCFVGISAAIGIPDTVSWQLIRLPYYAGKIAQQHAGSITRLQALAGQERQSFCDSSSDECRVVAANDRPLRVVFPEPRHFDDVHEAIVYDSTDSLASDDVKQPHYFYGEVQSTKRLAERWYYCVVLSPSSVIAEPDGSRRN